MHRVHEDPTKVEVIFYVLKNGAPLPAKESLGVFSQLSDVEMSALLGYPVSRCMLGTYLSILLLSSADFFQNELFQNFFQEHYQSLKQYGSRSGPTLCWS